MCATKVPAWGPKPMSVHDITSSPDLIISWNWKAYLAIYCVMGHKEEAHAVLRRGTEIEVWRLYNYGSSIDGKEIKSGLGIRSRQLVTRLGFLFCTLITLIIKAVFDTGDDQSVPNITIFSVVCFFSAISETSSTNFFLSRKNFLK